MTRSICASVPSRGTLAVILMTGATNTKLKISQSSNFIDSELLIRIMLILTLTAFIFGIFQLVNHHFLSALIMISIGILLTLITLYCLAFLHRILYFSDDHITLIRPYARFWFKKIKPELFNIPMNDIENVNIEKIYDGEGDIIMTWNISLKNRTTVSFKYNANNEDLTNVKLLLIKKGILSNN